MPIPDKKPYTHVRLICHYDGNLNQRYEIRVSTFVQFDENQPRPALAHQEPKQEAGIRDRTARADQDGLMKLPDIPADVARAAATYCGRLR